MDEAVQKTRALTLDPSGRTPSPRLPQRVLQRLRIALENMLNAVRFVVLALVVAASLCSVTQASVNEGEILYTIYGTWRNVSFPSWTSGGDPCLESWENVTCNAQGNVVGLNVSNRGIVGTLPEEIGGLSKLEVLDVSNAGQHIFAHLPQNAFSGAIPQSLANLTALKSLNISTILWNSSFPEQIFKLDSLEELEMSDAGLFGSLSDDFFALKRLRVLYLGGNSFTANFTKFTQLTNLNELSLYSIKFNTTIPADIGQRLPELTFLNLHDCSLHGALPDSFSTMQDLQNLSLYNNQLTGWIPQSWTNLQNLTLVRLNDNFLSGPFPTWLLTDLAKLRHLYLDNNFFYGGMPSADLISPKFELLRTDCNYMNGSNPFQNPPSQYRTRYNCFKDASTRDLTKVVTECDTHAAGGNIDCENFYLRIVNRHQCPPCPPSQYTLDDNPSTNPCICGYTGGPRRDSGGIPIGTVVRGVAALVVLFGVILGYDLWKRREQFTFLDKFLIPRKVAHLGVPPGVQRYTLAELATVTNNFSDAHVIGSGGFGKVFRATLDDGRMVAIKRASPDSVQGIGEFRNEVNLLSRLHHRHLVRLEGFCEEEGLEILVYEFMTNGNLHAHLLGNGTSTPLHWYKRLEIAVGVAQGLENLHSFADPPVIHRDVKPSNILLDENMVAKVADFGISRATEVIDTHVSIRPAGTPGSHASIAKGLLEEPVFLKYQSSLCRYLDPEYFLRRQLTTASDVYAFGVVLLELVTGQEAIDHKRHEEFNLVEWTKIRFRTSGILSVIDSLLDSDYPKKAHTVMVELGLACTAYSKDGRPPMKEAVTTLEPHLIQYSMYKQPLKARSGSRGSKTRKSGSEYDGYSNRSEMLETRQRLN